MALVKTTLRQGKKGVFADGLHSVVVESAKTLKSWLNVK